MKYKAVVFDLFGTLIDNFTIEEHERVLSEMASIVKAPVEGFIRLWFGTFNDRCLGILKTTEDNISFVCRGLGMKVEDSKRKEAADKRLALTANSMTPLPYAVEVLSRLKEDGYRTGLITDCSSEVPIIWDDTPFASLFDVTVFSCLAGIKKPDGRIYQLAVKGLEVEPGECLYVGDGSSNELTGAAVAGMHPVLIRNPQEELGAMHRVEAEGEKWSGLVINSLKEVLELVK